MIYWDTSALLKLYVAEPDSAYFLRLAEESEEPICSSAIVMTEALAAFHRKQHAGDLAARGGPGPFSASLPGMFRRDGS